MTKKTVASKKKPLSKPDREFLEGMENTKQLLRTLAKLVNGDTDFAVAVVLTKHKHKVRGMIQRND
jgi:hypothetical protein